MRDVTACFRQFAHLDRKRGAEGLRPDELERWSELKRVLAKEFSPGLSDARADERGSLRVPTRLQVTFRDLGELRKSLMTNLSRGGLFVVTDRPAAIGARLELRIHLEDSDRIVTVPAEVVCQNVGPGFASDRLGMGMRFLEMESDAERLIARLYENQLENAANRQQGSDE